MRPGTWEPKGDAILADEIEKYAKLAHARTDSDPAPPEILDFVHHQAVHEAGHAVAACKLEIRFDWVNIIYDPGVKPPPASQKDHDYCLGAAAGAAAEDLIFGPGGRQKWGLVEDRRMYKDCGGTDFEGAVAEVRKYDWFSKRNLEAVANSLERASPEKGCRRLHEKKVLKLLQEGLANDAGR